MPTSGGSEDRISQKESFIPSSDNPLTTGLNFIVTVLYTFALQDLLRAVFKGVGGIFDWKSLLAVLVLVEILHYAIEDYLYTDALEDSLKPEALDLEISKFMIHFLGVIFLLLSVYAIVFTLSPESNAALLSTGGTRELAAYILIGIALQQGTFLLWQILDRIKMKRFNSNTRESDHWIWRFSAYMLIEMATAITILWFSDIILGIVLLISIACLYTLDLRLGSYREVGTFPHPNNIRVTWYRLYCSFSVLLLLVASASILGSYNQATITVLSTGLLLFTIKAHYIHHWTGHYHDLLGTSKEESDEQTIVFFP